MGLAGWLGWCDLHRALYLAFPGPPIVIADSSRHRECVLCASLLTRERSAHRQPTNQPTQPACISMDGKRVLLICALLPSLSPSSKPIQACPKKLTFPFIYKTRASARWCGGYALSRSTVGARRERERGERERGEPVLDTFPSCLATAV
jgi:hypothetical protein